MAEVYGLQIALAANIYRQTDSVQHSRFWLGRHQRTELTEISVVCCVNANKFNNSDKVYYASQLLPISVIMEVFKLTVCECQAVHNRLVMLFGLAW